MRRKANINTIEVNYNGRTAKAAHPVIVAKGNNLPVQMMNKVFQQAAEKSIARQMKGTPYENYNKKKNKGYGKVKAN